MQSDVGFKVGASGYRTAAIEVQIKATNTSVLMELMFVFHYPFLLTAPG